MAAHLAHLEDEAMHAFLKVETSEAMAKAGCVAAAWGDAIHLVECLAGDEPDDGVEVDMDTVPDVLAEVA